jgi:hypothetical protein
VSEQRETVETERTETTEYTIEAEGGTLIVTFSALRTLPPGTFISINIQVPDAKQGGVERPDE